MIQVIEAFRDRMQSAGAVPLGDIIADGNLQRFTVAGDRPKSNNGYYVLHTDGIPAGMFGDWKRGIHETWSSREYHSYTPEEKEAYRRNMEAAKAAREAERQRIQEECRKWCTDAWEKAKSATNAHPYLERKDAKAYGLKVFRDSLMVPVKDMGGTLYGLQFINGEGAKKFKTGTRRGISSPLARRRTTSLLSAKGMQLARLSTRQPAIAF